MASWRHRRDIAIDYRMVTSERNGDVLRVTARKHDTIKRISNVGKNWYEASVELCLRSGLDVASGFRGLRMNVVILHAWDSVLHGGHWVHGCWRTSSIKRNRKKPMKLPAYCTMCKDQKPSKTCSLVLISANYLPVTTHKLTEITCFYSDLTHQNWANRESFFNVWSCLIYLC